MIKAVHSSSFQILVPGPVASESPGFLLKKYKFSGLYPRSDESENPGVGPSDLHFNKISRRFNAPSSLKNPVCLNATQSSSLAHPWSLTVSAEGISRVTRGLLYKSPTLSFNLFLFCIPNRIRLRHLTREDKTRDAEQADP